MPTTPTQYLLQVNAAPGSDAANQALALARSCVGDTAAQLAAVFFYFDGVNHAQGVGEHSEAWAQLHHQYQVPLLICRTAWERRHNDLPATAYRLSSLTDLVLWLERVDRLACFGSGAE